MRLKGGAMDAIYIGVDFHARQQTICYLKTETGELVISELKHEDKEQVRAFYQQFQEPVIVGLEASGYSPCFEALDRRDFQLIRPKHCSAFEILPYHAARKDCQRLPPVI